MSCILLHVKWEKYGSTEKSSLEDFHTKIFVLKIQALLYSGLLLGEFLVSVSNFFTLMRYELFILGLSVSARHLIKQLMEKERENEASGLNFMTKGIVGVFFCLPILLCACSLIWTTASQRQPDSNNIILHRH